MCSAGNIKLLHPLCKSVRLQTVFSCPLGKRRKYLVYVVVGVYLCSLVSFDAVKRDIVASSLPSSSPVTPTWTASIADLPRSLLESCSFIFYETISIIHFLHIKIPPANPKRNKKVLFQNLMCGLSRPTEASSFLLRAESCPALARALQHLQLQSFSSLLAIMLHALRLTLTSTMTPAP